MSANTLTSDQENIGDSTGVNGSGAFNQSGGSNTVGEGGPLYLGENTGDTGTYNLSGTAALSEEAAVYVGYNGAGIFNQSNGSNTDLTSTAAVYLAYDFGSTASYTLSGGTLSVASGAEDIGVSGNANFDQSNGTNSAENINIGVNPSSTVTYTLSGSGSLSTSREILGEDGLVTFNQISGTHSVGTGGLSIAFMEGSSATYLLSGGSLSVQNRESIGEEGVATFTQSGGSNSADELDLGGTLPNTYTLSAGTLSVTDGESLYNGAFNQSGGSNTISGGTGNLSVGDFVNAACVYNLSQTGFLSCVGGDETFGQIGTGSLIQTGGSNSIIASTPGLGNLFIGLESGSSGKYTLNGGVLSVGGSAYLGGSDTSSGGPGTLTIGALGQAVIAGVLQIWSDGKAKIDGRCTVGSLSVSSGASCNVDGSLLIDYASYGSGTPEAVIQQYIQSGQIISTFVQDNPTFGIAYADGSDPGLEDANLEPGQVVIEPDLLGDADLSGTVTFHDLQILLGNFGQPGFWDDGNFNGHSTVDFNDLQLLLGNFNEATTLNYSELSGMENLVGQFGETAIPNPDGTGFTLVSVPEPASLALLGSGLGFLAPRRRSSINR
jgi:hypothetical protein